MTITPTVTESPPPAAPAPAPHPPTDPPGPHHPTDPTDPHTAVQGPEFSLVRTGISPKEEFRLFAVEHTAALLRIAYLLCGDPHRAHDLTQTALERTYRHWSAVRGGNPFAYARRVLSTARIDGWRRTRREVLTSPEDLGALHDDTPGRQVTAPYADVVDRQQLVHALRRLGASQRRVIVLLDLSEADTAEELGLSPGTVKSHSARGLARLRQLLLEGTDA